MKTPPLVHGSFTIDRDYKAPVSRVFAAWADIGTKAEWFGGPPEKWTLLKRELDLRVGGREVLRGQFAGGHTSEFVARYHAIAPNERLVYAYDMFVGEKHLSVSLASVEFTAQKGETTRMTYTEHAAFLDGEDGTRSRKEGTTSLLDRVATVLADPRDIVSSRVLDAPRERVFRAFAEPERLAAWWGPKGFSNTFRAFELRPGGAWKFTMHGPDGKDYENGCEFAAVEPGRVVYRHLEPVHRFEMAMTFVDLGPKTLLLWRMRFDAKEEAERVAAFVVPANEENFDRLAAHLAKG